MGPQAVKEPSFFECVAIVGATGAVGREFGAVLEQRRFPARQYRLLASARSAGRAMRWCGRELLVDVLRPESFAGCDLALFSAGAAVSREFAPLACRAGAVVIDNSSAFRMDPDVPLVVPEVNAAAALQHRGIIANPNCSTIVLVVVLWPLQRVNPIRRVVVATYQAASGAGARALAELESQTRAVLAGEVPRPEVFPEPCAFNVFSHNSPLGPDGYNLEESKLIHETRKIFGQPPHGAESIQIAPTCIRVPVMRAHTEAAAIEFTQPMPEEEARALLAAAPGVRVVDDRQGNHFPTPLEATGTDEVLVGRIRQDASVPDGRGLQLLCSGDQLRKGAALNAVQIAEMLLPRT
jgi:aspartate-semialdehyde dehydrogenase